MLIAIFTSSIVSHYYDPLVAKIIAFGADRSEAIARLRHALNECDSGVDTNIAYLKRILANRSFQDRTYLFTLLNNSVMAPWSNNY